MPQIGCNFSPALMTLLQEGKVDVDWIKLSRWDVFEEELAEARPFRPVLLHTLPHAGRPTLEGLPWTWEAKRQAVTACGSPHIALHLLSNPSDWEAPPDNDALLERLVRNTAAWQGQFHVPLLVENVPYSRFRQHLRYPTDPEVIRTVCRETGAGLLLDLAHARVSAYHRGEDVREYLRALPLEAVREIHVCGPALDPVEGLRDRHLEMQEADYDLLSEALKRTNPLVVTLEYGGTGPKFEWRSDPDALLRQLERLSRLCG